MGVSFMVKAYQLRVFVIVGWLNLHLNEILVLG